MGGDICYLKKGVTLVFPDSIGPHYTAEEVLPGRVGESYISEIVKQHRNWSELLEFFSLQSEADMKRLAELEQEVKAQYVRS